MNTFITLHWNLEVSKLDHALEPFFFTKKYIFLHFRLGFILGFCIKLNLNASFNLNASAMPCYNLTIWRFPKG